MSFTALFFTVTTPGDTAVSAANPLPVTVAAAATSFVHLEDVASADGDAGVAILAIRDDTLNIRSGTEGDYEPLHTDIEGALWVRVAQSTDASLTVDNAALAVVGGGVEATALRVTIASDSTGVLSVDDNAGSLTVDGTVAVSSITTSITPGTAAANLGKAEDNAHAHGDVGVMLLGVRVDGGNNAAAFGAAGDYCPIATSFWGAVNVVLGHNDAGGSLSDGVSNSASNWAVTGDSPTTLSILRTANTLFNGTTWDRERSIIDANNTIGTGIQAAGLLAQFDDVSPTAITENQFGNLRMSLTHDLRTSYPVPEASAVIAPSVFQDFGSVTKDTVKGSAGNVFSIMASNANAALRYFQLHNKASDPAATEVPIISIPVPAGTAAAPTVLILGVDFFAPSQRHSTGIGWAWSTTDGEFTDSATASDHQTIVRYV